MSSIKSLKSDTNRGLAAPLQFLKGIGPRMATILERGGLKTFQDLLFFFPRAYETRLHVTADTRLVAGEKVVLRVEILSVRNIKLARGGRRLLEARTHTASGTELWLKWFHSYPGLAERLERNRFWDISGKLQDYGGRLSIVHPECKISTEGFEAEAALTPVAPLPAVAGESAELVPIYVEIEGVATRLLRQWIQTALIQTASLITEFLPQELLERHHFPQRSQALRDIHQPPPGSNLDDWIHYRTEAQRRWIYEEFFKFQYFVLKQRYETSRDQAPQWPLDQMEQSLQSACELLPFKLTGGQTQAVHSILHDLSLGRPMNRLIQGDVGSGKTAVAFLAAACLIDAGEQVAVMAPTEILAQQHARSAQKLLGDRLPVRLLTSRTSNAERKALLEELANGVPLLVIGTHALVEDDVQFKRLALALVDEQHRFGVEHRRRLREKGSRNGLKPHLLVLTATPIPRTLALTFYGDLSVSSIRELPPGRSPIVTRVLHTEQSGILERKVHEEVDAGRQIYWVLPLIEESEAEGFDHLASATERADELTQVRFPAMRVGLLHGRLSGEQKDLVLAAFGRREIDILVSTTVVEVGIDQPNATVMVIENAERFGLSQLHQLRGRVGRGSYASTCYLLTPVKPSNPSYQRLSILQDAKDGFAIAEADLKLRGPGEFLGTRQAGALPFRVADLIRDTEILNWAREDVVQLFQIDPKLEAPQHVALKNYLAEQARLEQARFSTS